MKGEHVHQGQLPVKLKENSLPVLHKQKVNVPIHFPNFTLNAWTVRAFNFCYYHKQRATSVKRLSSYDGFFYPLDAIHNWNRIYGRKGFTQYQFVIPKEAGKEGLRSILERISNSGLGSFLAVLKLMGEDQEQGLLSFPQKGYTLALDFPITNRLFPFLDELDHRVVEMGGRVYLAKDARLKPVMMDKMYPKLDNFREVLEKLNNKGQVSSLQAKRLKILG